jgi:hypothetical protein
VFTGAGLLFLLSWLLIPAAQAEKIFPLSIERMAARAALVLHGNVASKTVQRDPEGRIYTRIELEVAEAWKGAAQTNRFVLVQGGGVLGEEVAMASGQEEFSIGEEVVLFLVLNQRNEGVVIGLTQGKFKVAKDASGGKTVHNMFHGRAPGKTGDANGNGKGLSLGELKQRVQGGRP